MASMDPNLRITSRLTQTTPKEVSPSEPFIASKDGKKHKVEAKSDNPLILLDQFIRVGDVKPEYWD